MMGDSVQAQRSDDAPVVDGVDVDDEGEELARVIADLAWETKARGLRAVDVRGVLDYTDFVIICSGTSDRHVLAIADSIERALRPEKIRPMGVEGRPGGRWVLMDYGEVIVHIFVDDERDLYALDVLWDEAPELELDEPAGLERPAYS